MFWKNKCFENVFLEFLCKKIEMECFSKKFWCANRPWYHIVIVGHKHGLQGNSSRGFVRTWRRRSVGRRFVRTWRRRSVGRFVGTWRRRNGIQLANAANAAACRRVANDGPLLFCGRCVRRIRLIRKFSRNRCPVAICSVSVYLAVGVGHDADPAVDDADVRVEERIDLVVRKFWQLADVIVEHKRLASPRP